MTLLRSIIPSLGQATRIAKGQPTQSAEARIKPAFNGCCFFPLQVRILKLKRCQPGHILVI